MAATSAAAGLLSRQLKQMQGDKDIPGISCGLVGNSIFEWEVMLMINDECRYYGGENIRTPTSIDLALTACCRWLLPSDFDVPARISPPASENEVRNSYISS